MVRKFFFFFLPVRHCVTLQSECCSFVIFPFLEALRHPACRIAQFYAGNLYAILYWYITAVKQAIWLVRKCAGSDIAAREFLQGLMYIRSYFKGCDTMCLGCCWRMFQHLRNAQFKFLRLRSLRYTYNFRGFRIVWQATHSQDDTIRASKLQKVVQSVR